MNVIQLSSLLSSLVGKEINNLGNNNKTKIVAFDGSILIYQRGRTKISVNVFDIVSAYNNVSRPFSCDDLEKYNTSVFGNKRCNCTLLMELARLLKLGNIRGKGVRGNPLIFY